MRRALIMAQTTLNIYAADQIFKYCFPLPTDMIRFDSKFLSLVIRLLGSFVGLIVGVLVWYIGTFTPLRSLCSLRLPATSSFALR